jgi:hypothetical protein
MLSRSQNAVQSDMSLSFDISLKKVTPRKLSHMWLAVMRTSGSTCTSSVANGEWQARNARRGATRRRWSKIVFFVVPNFH